MTPEEQFRVDFKVETELAGEWEEALQELLATVREDARRAALDSAAVIACENGEHGIASAIRKLATPPRTLDDVLKDIKRSPLEYPDALTQRLFLQAVAQYAVEGLKELQGPPPEHGQRFTPFEETIRKLTGIR